MNDFFTRTLKGSARPIVAADDDDVVISGAVRSVLRSDTVSTRASLRTFSTTFSATSVVRGHSRRAFTACRAAAADSAARPEPRRGWRRTAG
jgi:hypothetical protein